MSEMCRDKSSNVLVRTKLLCQIHLSAYVNNTMSGVDLLYTVYTFIVYEVIVYENMKEKMTWLLIGILNYKKYKARQTIILKSF